ncbi:MAG: hypothetical protein WC610_03565 [Patescibacteria group bacterium]
MKKLLTYSVVVATIVWSLGLAAVVPLASAAYTATAGDVIKTATNTAVYYIDSDGKRHLFSNEATFWTWKSGSWATQGVQVISQTDFDALTSAANVVARAGVNLVKFDNSARVYAVAPGGVLSLIPSSAIASTLYGSTWSTKVVTIQSSFENDYSKTGTELTASSVLPNGSLIKYTGSADIYYIDGGLKRAISGDAFVANKFKDSAVVTVATSMTFTTGSSVTGQESALTTIAGTGAVTPVASVGTLTVALASDTPAAGIAVGSSIRVPFTTVSFTASSDGDITIDKMTVERKGSAVDANFSTLTLIDAATNVKIGVGQSLNALSQASFLDDIVVKAGTTKKIILAGNMASGTAGQIPQLALSAIVLKGTATVSGTLPITGNAMTVTSLAIGTPAVVRGVYQVSTSTDIKVGTVAQIVGAFKISADSVEGQRVKQIKFYNSGTSALDTDISNYKLLVDNATPVTAVFTKDGKYLTAEFSANSVLIEKGKSKEFVLKADILSGSTRTIILSIYRTDDVVASGDTFGYMKTPTYSSTGSSAGNPVMANDQLTISVGTLRIESSSVVAAQDISYGDAQTLGSFNLVVAGETVSITALTLAVSSTTANIDNVKLIDKDGATLWGPNDASSGSVAYTATVQLPVGSNLVKVVADIESTGDGSYWASNETFYFSITGSTITATGMTTNDSVTASPTGVISANTMTFKPAKLTITANSLPTTGNVSLGAKKALYGSWAFSTSGSGENVKISAITLANETATTTNLDSVTLYDVTNKTNCTTKYPNATLDSYGCLLAVKDGYDGTTTWTLTDPIIITKNTTISLELRADVRTTAATYQNHADGFVIRNDGTVVPVTATGVLTSNTVTPTGSAYNPASNAAIKITIAGAGSLTMVNSASAPASRIVAEGQTYEIGRVKITATNEALNISDLSVCVGTGAADSAGVGDRGDISNVKVYKSTALTTPIIDASLGAVCESFSLPQDSLQIPTGSAGVELVIKATMAKVDNASIDETGLANASVALGFGGTDGITAKGVSSGLTVTSETITSNTSTAVILHKSYPSVSIVAPAIRLFASGVVMYDLTISNPTSEPIGIYRLSFIVSTSTDANIKLTTAGLQAKRSDWATFKQISADVAFAELDGTSDAYFSFVLYNPDSVTDTKTELRLGAGQSAQFQLIGRTVDGLDATLDGSIQIRFLGDTASTTLDAYSYSVGAPAALFVAQFQGNFVWSDLYTDDGPNATNTNEWYNGYLVNGLQSSSTVYSIPE